MRVLSSTPLVVLRALTVAFMLGVVTSGLAIVVGLSSNSPIAALEPAFDLLVLCLALAAAFTWAREVLLVLLRIEQHLRRSDAGQ